ncbi:GntR family transcriptional regulator [Paludibaculum fermentans]|uniref:GntR family transcriptional regulator n=1 Tax=Paludibaculum fermentans TaxID=1473598 RepID=A0A7S7NKR9_PALFE|nr:GntR family transcriptional regulator [Paludibaculum fermentans]QOY85456.1 GntR family transcriptional regulator [Paludibaculum fermentans]
MSKSEPFRFRLDNATGVPVYRQLIDQVQLAIASGAMRGGDQLPTVRQVAVDLAINPNTVMRAYRELEIRGTLATQQGLGTFVSLKRVEPDHVQHDARLSRLAAECAARAGAEGFSVRELIGRLADLVPDNEPES